MVDIASVLASVGTSVIVSVAASLLVVEYRYKREDVREAAQQRDDWYAEAAELGRAVQNTWRTKFQRPYNNDEGFNSDELQREMNLYQSQLSTHASQAAHLDVAEDVVEALEETADACREVYAIRTHMNDGPDFQATGETVTEAANRLEARALAEL